MPNAHSRDVSFTLSTATPTDLYARDLAVWPSVSVKNKHLEAPRRTGMSIPLDRLRCGGGGETKEQYIATGAVPFKFNMGLNSDARDMLNKYFSVWQFHGRSSPSLSSLPPCPTALHEHPSPFRFASAVVAVRLLTPYGAGFYRCLQ